MATAMFNSSRKRSQTNEDNLSRVLEENETNMLFRPHLNKILVAFHAARAQVKRQINASIDKRKCVNDENDNGVGDENHEVQITHKETSDDEGQSSDDNDADDREVDNDHLEVDKNHRDDRIRAGDYVQIIKGDFYGYFAIVDPDQDEIDSDAVRITYFKEQIGRDGKYWLINELDADTRSIGEFLKVNPISIERRGKIIF